MDRISHPSAPRRRHLPLTVFTLAAAGCLALAAGAPAQTPSCGGDLDAAEQYVQQWSEPCVFTFVAADPRRGGGSLAQYFVVNIDADFPRVLSVVGPDGNELPSDDWQSSESFEDGFEGGRKISGRLPGKGTYELRVGSSDGQPGTLVIGGGAQFESPAHFGAQRSGCIGGMLKPGASVTKTLSSGTGGCGFRFIAVAGDTVTIAVTSSQVDPAVEIRSGSETLASDDDGGEGSNSLISDFKLTKAGRYDVMVTSKNSADGSFTIRLTK